MGVPGWSLGGSRGGVPPLGGGSPGGVFGASWGRFWGSPGVDLASWGRFYNENSWGGLLGSVWPPGVGFTTKSAGKAVSWGRFGLLGSVLQRKQLGKRSPGVEMGLLGSNLVENALHEVGFPLKWVSWGRFGASWGRFYNEISWESGLLGSIWPPGVGFGGLLGSILNETEWEMGLLGSILVSWGRFLVSWGRFYNETDWGRPSWGRFWASWGRFYIHYRAPLIVIWAQGAKKGVARTSF